jgi:hypothetical protein
VGQRTISSGGACHDLACVPTPACTDELRLHPGLRCRGKPFSNGHAHTASAHRQGIFSTVPDLIVSIGRECQPKCARALAEVPTVDHFIHIHHPPLASPPQDCTNSIVLRSVQVRARTLAHADWEIAVRAQAVIEPMGSRIDAHFNDLRIDCNCSDELKRPRMKA